MSQPWLVEAVGTAEWTGTPLGPLLAEAGVAPDAVEVVFTGADRGIQGDVEQDYQRSLTVADAQPAGGAARLRDERRSRSSRSTASRCACSSPAGTA